jgi:hypothetical protein
MYCKPYAKEYGEKSLIYQGLDKRGISQVIRNDTYKSCQREAPAESRENVTKYYM